MTSSLGGGLVHGDDVTLDVRVDAGATAVITTQASTKIYKGSSRQRTDVRVAGDGAALVVPDPVVPYRDATFTQVTDVDLGNESTLVLCDVLTAGRVAYGERWSAARLDVTLRITRAGACVLHDRLLLAGDVASRMQRFTALATAIVIGPRVHEVAAAGLAALAGVGRSAPVIVAGSPFCDGAIFRMAGEDVERTLVMLRALLSPACRALGEDPWSRKW